MPQVKYVTIGKDEYEIASDEARILTEFIHKVWVASGKPDRLEGESAWQVVDAIIKAWAAGYPDEWEDWKSSLTEEQSAERSVHDSNKDGGGYFPIAYPVRVMQMMKIYFKKDRLQDRKIINKFVQRYPFLKITKYKI
jgi:hypothetical protein